MDGLIRGMDIKNLPNFLGIGAPRSGTTFLSHLLNQHPELYLPKNYKEVHFFDNNFHRGFKWYSSFYKSLKGEKAIGDFTPSYMSQNNVILRIKEYKPDLKILVCLRDPVERTYSHFMQRARFQNWKNDFDETIKLNDKRILDYGKYRTQLDELFKNFPMSQVKIIIFEDLIKNPQLVLNEVFEFLNLYHFEINFTNVPKNHMKEFHFKFLQKMIRGIRSFGRKYIIFRILLYEIFPGKKIISKIKK